MTSPDPLQRKSLDKLASNDISALKFAKLHSPKMKSVYWRYFGFPTNEHDRIITKQNVVCTLCHKVLTNHGNTTNLRAHLQHRHKEIFKKICAENGIKVPPRKPQLKGALMRVNSIIKREPLEHKIKLEYQDTSQDEPEHIAVEEEQTSLYETLVPMTYEDDEIIDADHFAKVEVGGGGTDITSENKIIDPDVEAICVVESKSMSNFRMDVIEEIHPYQLQDALVNMIVQDIRNVNTLSDPGMTQFIRTFSVNTGGIPSEKKIETLIKELHSDKLTQLTDDIKIHSQIKPFSLAFEIWVNIEQKHFLSIYYNYATDAPEYNLLNRLYTTFEYNKYTSIDAVFEEFNLENCTAAIVSYDYDDYLKHFLRNKNIPIILSYDVIVDKCLRDVFELPEVSSIIVEVKDVVMRYASEINSKDVKIPTVNPEFPWTHYELLKFFSETVSWPEDVDILVSTSKSIVGVLSTLAVTLDTLKGEEIPHSSMLSPITTKILNKKLAISENDDQFIATIKTKIITELEKLVIADDHLTISALLDPRFHRLTNINNFSNCLQILTDKFKRISELDGCASITAVEPSSKPNISTPKKSNLELFFDIQESSQVIPLTESSSVESDLKRYRNEVYVSLDESPFLWWNKMGHLYGSLKQLSSLYQCVPCVVNMNFKKPINQQMHEHQKRYMLTGNLIDAILFLHDNLKCESYQGIS